MSTTGRATLVARAPDLPTYSVLIQQHGTLFDAAKQLPRMGELQGRALALVVEIAGTACVVRHYHRGGAARLLGDRYARWGPNRALRELQVSESARARGVATPAVKCVAWYHRAIFRRSDIATRYMASTRDLADTLFGGETADAERATRAAAQLIRDMLRAGLVHSDLNLKNILVAPDRAYVVDLDKCSVEEGVSTAHSKSMRERFLRSLTKWERATGKTVAAGLRSQLIGAFGG